MGENILVDLQRKLPLKCKDLGRFMISCIIGDTIFEKVMLNLRALINVMLYSIYAILNLDNFKETIVVIQLINYYNTYPKRDLGDVLV